MVASLEEKINIVSSLRTTDLRHYGLSVYPENVL